jgi:cell division protein FtsI (penicillin-binding protein 3)
MTMPPRPGHSVTLTVSYVMQDICDRALADVAARLHVSGGDIVVLQPNTGEVRCLASWRESGKSPNSLALVEPFEPGSTLKPFIAGRMVENNQARIDEVIETYNGKYKTCGRTINDVHAAERLSMADVIRYSSNIGIARFTERLTKRELYELLRDFGFGAPTGISYPVETGGVLKEPRQWSCPSQSSMATGYEISVTAVQLAAAYGAIANDGLLLVPTLVKSIHDADGEQVFEHRPQLGRVGQQVGTVEQPAQRRVVDRQQDPRRDRVEALKVVVEGHGRSTVERDRQPGQRPETRTETTTPARRASGSSGTAHRAWDSTTAASAAPAAIAASCRTAGHLSPGSPVTRWCTAAVSVPVR